MPEPKLILDHVYDHEAAQPDRIFLTQPVGGGEVIDYCWHDTLERASAAVAPRHPVGGPFDAVAFAVLDVARQRKGPPCT